MIDSWERAIRRFIFIIIFFSIQNLFATENRTYSWIETSIKKEIGEGLDVSMESELRYSFDDEIATERIFKLGAHYKLTDDHTFGVLYQYDEEFDREENRIIFQSNLILAQFGRNRIFQRIRFEGREFKKPSATEVRARFRIGYDHQWNELLKVLILNEVFFAISDSQGPPDSFISRNRLKLGVQFSFESFSFGLGYVNQVNFGKSNQLENIIATSIGF